MNETKSKTLSDKIYEEFSKTPEGAKLRECIQCGTCSGSCPVARSMDYTPRHIIAMLRAGKIGEVLKSDTVWICASCYSCTVRCPAGIKYTDFLYLLKRMGQKAGISPENKKGLNMAKSFYQVLSEYGRSYEPELMVRSNITTPFNLLGFVPFALKLLSKNRLPILPAKVKGAKYIRKALNAKE